MRLADALPSPGILDMLGIALSIGLAGPLVVATVLFASRGEFAMAGFTAVLAAVALYLPTYVVGNLLPDSIVLARLRKLRDRLPFR